MPSKPSSVDQYIAEVADPRARESLLRLRAVILDELPDAQEVISYGIPSYKLNGMVASIAAFKNHCSFFPGYIDAFAEELKTYKTAKGTIQFAPGSDLPEPLVRDILRAKVARLKAADKSQGSRTRTSAALKKPRPEKVDGEAVGSELSERHEA